jgi:hypothetical protein
MIKPRNLTKSRFKLGMDCPTKLYYTRKPEYVDSSMDDSFLAALAEGGYQVGELAKCYHPGGHDIVSLDYDEAQEQTYSLLTQDEVTIFEPAIKFENLFIRIDILEKKKNHFNLIEVKAKSFDNNLEEPFFNKNGTIQAGWLPYLHDVAFQKYVLQNAYPNMSITSFLMLADKNSKCPVDGLNQKFKITRDESNRKGIKVATSLNESDLAQSILIKVEVDDLIDQIMESGEFEKQIKFLAQVYEQDQRITSPIGNHCGGCEFQCSPEDEARGFKNGFKECWKVELGWDDEDFNEPNVLEVWSYRGKDNLIEEGRVKMSDLIEDDFDPKSDKKPGISASERRWLQVEKVQNSDNSPYFDKDGIHSEMNKWTFPLHFIDFETSMVAIPFNKGRKPYEAIAFQFSHHVVHEDGTVEHAGQYLNTNPGEFPNYDFLRELKKQLENDKGTIFRYSPHENTFLNHIYRQLKEDNSEIVDRKELCDFIKSITTSSSSMAEKWEGERNMVDLWHLVKRFYYDPYTKGSNSIKYVLPAVLNSSEYLQNKYSSPIYGSESGIKSCNFKNWIWLEKKNGEVIDPYKKLPKLFQDVSDKNFELLSDEDQLDNGGAALMAYGRMQFSDMSEIERIELAQGLLRYCELDTLAMVMIYEAWKEWCSECI